MTSLKHCLHSWSAKCSERNSWLLLRQTPINNFTVTFHHHVAIVVTVTNTRSSNHRQQRRYFHPDNHSNENTTNNNDNDNNNNNLSSPPSKRKSSASGVSRERRDLVLYDSLSKKFQSIAPLPPPPPPPPQTHSSLSSSTTTATTTTTAAAALSQQKGLAWYTCGPTTYAPAHLGHARTYVWIDILRRLLEHVSEGRSNYTPPPLFVMNITDVDDKILAAAKESSSNNTVREESSSPLQLARRYEAEFWRDMDALGCLRPHVVTRVTEHVESAIIPYIAKLESTGMAYHIPGVGVYFHVRAFESKLGHITKYGKLAPPAAATDFVLDNDMATSSTSTTTINIKKHDARDFAIWKCRKDGEDLFWDSPWGPGRPGWHIECSAMIEAVQERFRDTYEFLVHAGGIDLKFPHHTNEIAQAEAYHHMTKITNTSHGKAGEWIAHWVHTGHVHIDGLKMSKSLKNFITIEELLSKDDNTNNNVITSSPLVSPADDFRWWCIGMSGSYRGPATFSYQRIQEAQIIRQKVVRFLLDGEDWLRKRRHEQQQNKGWEEGFVKIWRQEDVDFFRRVNEASSNCLQALLGLDDNDALMPPFDVDGAAFVQHLLDIAEAGGDYLRNYSSSNTTPSEPLIAVLSTVRKLLSLVGFTDATTRAGLEDNVVSNERQRQGVSCGSVGVGVGERALIDELVRFRALVRKAVLTSDESSSSGGGGGGEATASNKLKRQILEYSDDIRKNRLPAIGIEIMDPKVVDESCGSGSDEKEEEEEEQVGQWRFCLPREPESKKEENNKPTTTTTTTKPVPPPIDLTKIPIEDFFKVGQFAGQFSEYTVTGIPTHHADGKEISKALLKKLLKKRDKYMEKLK